MLASILAEDVKKYPRTKLCKKPMLKAIKKVLIKAEQNLLSDTQTFKQDRIDSCNCQKTRYINVIANTSSKTENVSTNNMKS